MTNNVSEPQNAELHKNLVDRIISASGLSSDDLMPLSSIFNVVAKQLCSFLAAYTPAKIHAEVATIEPFLISDSPQVIGKNNYIVPGRIEKWSSEILIILTPEIVDIISTAFFGGTNFLDETHDKIEILKPSLKAKLLQKAALNQSDGQDAEEAPDNAKSANDKDSAHNSYDSEDEDEEEEDIQLTPVERQVANTMVQGIARSMIETFGEGDQNFLTLGRSFHSTRLDTKEYFSSRFFLCRIKLKIQHIYVNFDLLLPRSCHRFIQNAIAKMLQTSSNWADPIWTKRMHAEIRKTKVNVTASIMQGHMSLKTLSELYVGQVLPLKVGSAQNIILRSGKKPLYVGVLGKVGHNLSVRVREIIDQKNNNK